MLSSDYVRAAASDVLEPIVWAADQLTAPAPPSWPDALAAAAILQGIRHGRI